MALVSATAEQFAAFKSAYGFGVADDDGAALVLSFAFVRALPFRPEAEIDAAQLVEAQCFIAHAITANGGGFKPTAIAEAKTLTKKGLGRGAITKEWKVNELLSGNDPLSLLRSMVIPYGLLEDYLRTGTAGVFVV